ncbi:pyridoxal-dependent decarboxylase [Pseudoalteromonas tunicata]|jgi:histidine decarboxylase|uniref:Glutamate decarboxylase n=1 Tax=Pseudoalteromonas tunicata D2 TaxID=87626 RepID=A4C388_9GAMM|nr:pyridoxal-dependent decarboxylase [Pseudoalteromonas tunicata]ATC96700.1 histidine decarboxylase [Pseudoalteromonas tunicata]AXT32867.1 glutamate decarboxylase [Pseudoalteromonas tunicata]EAR30020.1 Glutamate decarboxylase [Pseudoalteromonas tunicata D2]
MYVDKKTQFTIPFGPDSHPWISQIPDLAYGQFGELLITPPSADPAKVYEAHNTYFIAQQQHINEKDLQLPAAGQQQKQAENQEKLHHYLLQQKEHFLGYQVVVNTDYSELFSAMNTMINNLGDPFTNGFCTVNSKPAERAVLDFYASVWRANWPAQRTGNPDSYWGYVLSMGSTEGNMYAMLSARDYLSGHRLVVDQNDHHLVKPKRRNSNPNYYKPIAFFSEDTHYSISKAIHAMGIPSFYDIGSEFYPNECPLGGDWPRQVPSEQASKEELYAGKLGSGCIDIGKLQLLVEFFAKKGHPILIILNYGTTFKGAYDDIPGVYKALKDIFIQYGLVNREVCFGDKDSDVDIRQGYWIHVDGALGASFMPFINMAMKTGKLNADNFFEHDLAFPEFDFSLPYIHSIVTSGHKFLGAPTPCGIYMSKQKYLATMNNPQYVGAPDSTLAGSRNGLAALTLWSMLGKTGYAELQARAIHSLTMTQTLYQRFSALAKMIKQRDGIDIWLHRSAFSLCILFRRTNPAITFKYSLCEAQEAVSIDGVKYNRHYVHLYCMWDRKQTTLDSLMIDLAQPGAFDKTAEIILSNSALG